MSVFSQTPVSRFEVGPLHPRFSSHAAAPCRRPTQHSSVPLLAMPSSSVPAAPLRDIERREDTKERFPIGDRVTSLGGGLGRVSQHKTNRRCS